MQEKKGGFNPKPFEEYPNEWGEQFGTRWVIRNERVDPLWTLNHIEVPLRAGVAILVPGNVADSRRLT